MCHVTLFNEKATIHFTVEDNGLGGQICEGNGLHGMRERVEAMTGAMKVTASADEGTSLEIILPLESVSEEQSGKADPL